MTDVNTESPSMTSEVELNVAELLEWERWTPASIAFLEGRGEAVELREVIRKHGQLVIGINAWLHDELARANDRALAEVSQLVVERNAALTGLDLDEAARRTQEWTEMRGGATSPGL